MGLVSELRRRNVFRVAIAYVIIAWLILQVGDTLAPSLHLDEWVNSALAFFLILGFPVAVFFAWAYELTPDGIRLEKHVGRGHSITHVTGRKLDYLIIALLTLALVSFAFDKFVLGPSREAELVQATTEAISEKPVETDKLKNYDRSIAVLPFSDLSPDGDQEYFSDGVAEEILNVLVRIDSLKVASRTSSFGFKGQGALGIPLIAEKLNVRHVLEGSVRKSGDMVRITALLIDAETDQPVWSETYDRVLSTESIFAIQDEIAEAVVARLGAIVDEDQGGVPSINITADTQSLDAYELYLRAHQLFVQRSTIPRCIELFEQSASADSGFARAWAGLAAAYAIAPSWNFEDRDYFQLAANAALKAIDLNPDLALPYAVLGKLATEKIPADFAESFIQFDKALKRDPKEKSAWLWQGMAYNATGFFDDAEHRFQRCLEIDPAYEICRRHMALSRLFSGETERALELFEQGLLAGAVGHLDLFARAYAARGDYAVVLMRLATKYRNLGLPPLIELEYRALTDPTYDFDSERSTIEAIYQATTGDKLDWAESGLSALSFGNYAAVQPDTNSPAIWYFVPADFRVSPHRKRVMREIGLPEYWREHGFPPQCRPIGDDDFECE